MQCSYLILQVFYYLFCIIFCLLFLANNFSVMIQGLVVGFFNIDWVCFIMVLAFLFDHGVAPFNTYFLFFYALGFKKFFLSLGF